MIDMPLATGTDLAPDPDAITCFVDLAFGYLEGLVPVRLLSEPGTPPKIPVAKYLPVERLPETLLGLAGDAASQARAVYVVPATVAKAGSARATDIQETGVVVVDLDAGDIETKQQHLADHLGPASLVVASGGMTTEGQAKRHLYWRLTEAAKGQDLERVRAMREMIADKVGGDRSFASLHQPIRVAGTIHGKNGKQAPVQILSECGLEYDLSDLEGSVRDMPFCVEASARQFPQGARTKPSIDANAANLARRKVRAGGVDGITRFEALSRVIGHWVRNARYGKCDLQEAWAAVCDHNAACMEPPWEEPRLRREFDALLKRDVDQKGPMPTNADDALRTRGGGLDQPDAAPVPPAASDDALAALFVERHGGAWRHVGAWGSWYQWTGTRWTKDETGLVRETMRQVCRDAAARMEKPGEARRIASDRTIAAALRLSATDPRIATRPDDWDAHPMLLNTPDGVLDLETGETREHAPDLLITQQTTAEPVGACPRWRTFIDEVTDGDTELQLYLARLAGYCLTGRTDAQVFAFLLGSGANGKSVFLQTIAGILGDYAATATLDTFMDARNSRHLTELAGLRAARLVVVPETEAGRAWAEGRIKMVTGGERVRANFMHRDHFEFTPRFKLVVMGNHRPSLSSVGEAMRRRMHLVPFSVTVPEERRDPSLPGALMAEKAGILAWMVDGCADWQRNGLAPPARMRAAADAYFEAEDIVGQWIDEMCVLGPNSRTPSRTLFASWSAWATAAGYQPGSQKALGEALRARGLRDGKVAGARGWIGIGHKTTPASREPAE